MTQIRAIDISHFLELASEYPVLDVRSPAEFAKGHIPGAHNLPLFSDDERALVGTLYKIMGRKAAMLAGLESIGPRMRKYVETIEQITPKNELLLHCWRGGLRSNSVAWLLSLFDYQVTVLNGGYKTFRHFVLQSLALPQQVIILSGRTGSKKTAILQELRRLGEQIIDLEALANHKGSSFGSLGENPQPTAQQFENRLAMQWQHLDPQRPVWLEDESRQIGSRTLPKEIWMQMRHAPVLFLDIPVAARTAHLIQEYGGFLAADLHKAVERLQERLGGAKTAEALDLLAAGNRQACCELLLLHYYDRMYLHGLSKRSPEKVHRLEADISSPAAVARQLRQMSHDLLIPREVL